jgi:ATP-dependent DNA helicase RecG
VSGSPVEPLAQPVTVLSGVGPERANQLARLDIRTVGDLLLHGPHRYEDRRHLQRIGELELHETAVVCAKVVDLGVKYWQRRRKSVFELVLDDRTGRLHARWWNMPFMERDFQVGDMVFLCGRLVGLKPRTMDHPETETIQEAQEASIHLNRIVPVYPLTEGLTQRWLRAIIWGALEQYGSQLAELWPALTIPDLPSRAAAIRKLHFPEELPDTLGARRRLALDEFIELQLAIQRRRRNLQTKARGLPCGGTNRLIKPFLAQLGFKLTEAQTGVLREIRQDMSGPHPMRRLLQGDVGSGKTVVAACGALMAIESSFNVALMAPTEILAEQHFRTFQDWFTPLAVPVELLTGSRKTGAPNTEVALLPLAPGNAQTEHGQERTAATLYLGTHALLEEAFAPPNLGLVVIDEQHKFGVAQRETLVRKGDYPHVLVMTATPIPRTLGLTLYGDLDCSVIAASPPGRGPLRTYLRDASRLPQVYEFIRRKIAEGRQAYVVYPRVEESDPKAGVKAVTQEFERLREVFSSSSVGLLHGRLPAEEKEAVMAAFRANRLQVLVSTTVVEVGMDIPNATIMLVENAESFGLAQLHQLRGRIGRSRHEAYCILVAAAKTLEAKQRLKVLVDTTDGFQIAEADLRLRGPGELLGQQQSGLPRFRFGDLAEDLSLIEQARRVASQLLAATPP